MHFTEQKRPAGRKKHGYEREGGWEGINYEVGINTSHHYVKQKSDKDYVAQNYIRYLVITSKEKNLGNTCI